MTIQQVTVWRVEHPKTGIGPYRQVWQACGANQGLLAQAHQGTSHPEPFVKGEPWEDFIWDMDGPNLRHERLGFLYLSDLNRWFDGWIEILLQADFQIVPYNVYEDCVRLGNHQVSFCTTGKLYYFPWDKPQAAL